MVRLAVALGLFVILYFLGTTGLKIWLVACILCVIAFVLLVTYHQNLHEKKLKLEALVDINQNENKALNRDLDDFPDGKEFNNSAHEYSLDLDLFGPSSLFQFLNRTCTTSGKKRLADILTQVLNNPEDIYLRQEILKDLSQKVDFRQNFQAAGSHVEEDPSENEALMNWFEEPNYFSPKKVLNILSYLMPIILIALFVLGLLVDSKFHSLAGIFILINWLIWGAFSGKINSIHFKIGKKNGILNKYLMLLEEVGSQKFDHPHLGKMQSIAGQSIAEIKQFKKIVTRFDQRLNIIMGIFMNSIFLWDIHCVMALEKWKSKNKDNFKEWLDVLFEFDALNSLGNFTFCNPTYSWPEIKETGLSIEGEGLGHPLMKSEECIVNDIEMGKKEKMVILTGANMSGKSTFLRSLGLNTVLALIGAPVFAKKLRIPILKVISSMRVTDSLKENTSYFYSELKRLKSIINALEDGDQLLIVLDEILKGTNSEDKLSGSVSLIKNFLNFESLGIIATHDLELGKLEQELPGQVSNYCFESTIENDELYFDYTINDGVAKNKNATFLMKQMEII